MTMINDEIFGELEYDYTWYRKDHMLFAGKKEEIVILVAGDEEGDFEEGQYEAFKMLNNKWDEIQEMLLEKILEYYMGRREELGYEIEQNKDYPEILSTKQLLEHITLVGIKIPYAEIYGGRSVGLSFDCTWDKENGLGARLSDENVIRVGFQDIAI